MAYEIPLLQPVVLQGVVERFPVQESLTLLNKVPRRSVPHTSVQWDVIRGARAVARPNVPNSEAHIVPQLSRSAQSAAFSYVREKKVFEPTTVMWLRQAANNNSELARRNATEHVTREIADLNQRFDNYAEYLLWQALTGEIDITYDDGTVVNVDYDFLDSHKATAATPWATATPQQIVGDVRALRAKIRRDGRVDAKEAYVSEGVMDYIVAAFTRDDSNLLSDRMRDQYYASGELPGFLGLNWRVQDSVYDVGETAYSNTGNPDTDTGVTRFLAEDTIILGDFDTNRPVELAEGLTGDFSAGSQDHTGKFAKTWTEQDPSARQYLLEWSLLPVVTRPEQIATLNVGT